MNWETFNMQNSNANFGVNHIINGGGFGSCPHTLTTPNTADQATVHINTTCQNPRDFLISHMRHAAAGFGGQVGVMSQTRCSSFIAPQPQPYKVHQVHTVIDYFPSTILQNHSIDHLGPNNEVCFTVIVRTQFLTATSTRERILHFSNNHTLLDLNPPHHINHYDQNRLAREHAFDLHHNQYPNPPPPTSTNPISHLETLRLMENVNHENNQNDEAPVDHDHEEDYSDDGIGDGRTHSLPCKKYGPYTCPRCMGVFCTSQLFAAHMGSHYKYETPTQRSRRRRAKYASKSKSLRLVRSRKEGLTVLPLDDDTNMPLPPPPSSPPPHSEPLAELELKQEPLDLAFN